MVIVNPRPQTRPLQVPAKEPPPEELLDPLSSLSLSHPAPSITQTAAANPITAIFLNITSPSL
jgi:hypothetical protein